MMATFSTTRTVTGYPCCNLKIVNTRFPAFFSQKLFQQVHERLFKGRWVYNGKLCA